MHIRAVRSITLAVLAGATIAVAACSGDVDAPVVHTVDSVHTVDTVRVVDTVGVLDTLQIIDTVQLVYVYDVAFQQDSAQQDTSCPGYLYCRVTVPATAEFTGSLMESQDSIAAAIDHEAFDALPLTALHLDSLPTQFSTYGECYFLTLNVTGTPSELHGRWTEQLDCHGRYRTGTLVATRH